MIYEKNYKLILSDENIFVYFKTEILLKLPFRTFSAEDVTDKNSHCIQKKITLKQFSNMNVQFFFDIGYKLLQ